jgi:hypothetical protein
MEHLEFVDRNQLVVTFLLLFNQLFCNLRISSASKEENGKEMFDLVWLALKVNVQQFVIAMKTCIEKWNI